MAKMFKLNYPIETPEAYAFWASRHKCNVMKSYIAYSTDLADANDNLKRAGYSLHWRKKAIASFGKWVAYPEMRRIPFSELETPYWECMPYDGTVVPPFKDYWDDPDHWNDQIRWNTAGVWANVGDEFWVNTSNWEK